MVLNSDLVVFSTVNFATLAKWLRLHHLVILMSIAIDAVEAICFEDFLSNSFDAATVNVSIVPFSKPVIHKLKRKWKITQSITDFTTNIKIETNRFNLGSGMIFHDNIQLQ